MEKTTIKFRVKDLSKIKLNKSFEVLAKYMGEDFPKAIEEKKNINNDSFPSNSPSTIRSKGFNHWMKNKGNFIKNAFKTKSAKNYAECSISNSPSRGGGLSYRGLAKIHLQRGLPYAFFGIGKRLINYIQKQWLKKEVSEDVKKGMRKAPWKTIK